MPKRKELKNAGLLRALAHSGTDSPAAWLAHNALDNATVEWLDVRGLAPYAFHRLSELRLIDRAAAEPRTGLGLAYCVELGQALAREQQLQRILVALAVAEITPILFKGAVLAYTAYSAPACRPMGDLDLWLTAEEMPRGKAALEALGYRQKIDQTRPPAFQERRLGNIKMIGAHPGDILVELHWSAFPGVWLNRAAAVDHAAIRARAVPVTVAGRPVLTPALEDAIIQLAVHLAVSHQMAAPGVRGLLDVALLARTQPVDWVGLADRAQAWRVGTAVWLVLQLTSELGWLTEAAPAVARLRPDPVRRYLLARLVNAGSMLAMRDISRGPLRYALFLLLVDRNRDVAAIVARAVWPERDWLIARYGRAGLGVRLRHLSGAVRGRF
ncbi:MAG: nucleotidyltransferase family protein [Acidobacteriota bacterium]|nr:nucleotidyltransferase family protein [Acidobacteriota bacterium]